MPQFDFTTYYSQIFWLVITFGLLYVFVSKFIIPKAEKIFSNRQTNIDDNIKHADKLALKVQELNQYYDTELSKIISEIEEFKKNTINSLESTFLAKKNNLEKDLRILISQNIDNINLTAQEFWLSKNEACIKLASSIIEKITQKQADINLLKNIKIK